MATKLDNAAKNSKATGAPSPVVWFEVVGKDGPALQRYYGRLFNWEIVDAGDGSGYGVISAAPKGIGGGVGASPDGGAGHVTFYVEIDDPAAYLKRANELGGKTIMPPTDFPQFNLTVALFADPEGHVVGLSRGAVQ